MSSRLDSNIGIQKPPKPTSKHSRNTKKETQPKPTDFIFRAPTRPAAPEGADEKAWITLYEWCRIKKEKRHSEQQVRTWVNMVFKAWPISAEAQKQFRDSMCPYFFSTYDDAMDLLIDVLGSTEKDRQEFCRVSDTDLNGEPAGRVVFLMMTAGDPKPVPFQTALLEHLKVVQAIKLDLQNKAKLQYFAPRDTEKLEPVTVQQDQPKKKEKESYHSFTVTYGKPFPEGIDITLTGAPIAPTPAQNIGGMDLALLLASRGNKLVRELGDTKEVPEHWTQDKRGIWGPWTTARPNLDNYTITELSDDEDDDDIGYVNQIGASDGDYPSGGHFLKPRKEQQPYVVDEPKPLPLPAPLNPAAFPPPKPFVSLFPTVHPAPHLTPPWTPLPWDGNGLLKPMVFPFAGRQNGLEDAQPMVSTTKNTTTTTSTFVPSNPLLIPALPHAFPLPTIAPIPPPIVAPAQTLQPTQPLAGPLAVPQPPPCPIHVPQQADAQPLPQPVVPEGPFVPRQLPENFPLQEIHEVESTGDWAARRGLLRKFRMSDITATRLEHWMPTLNSEDERKQYIETVGADARVGRRKEFHGHPISAALRKLVTAKVMAAILREDPLDLNSILSVYSSNRDSGLIEKMNEMRDNLPLTIGGENPYPTALYSYRPIIMAKDYSRRSFKDVPYQGEALSGAFLYDVYHVCDFGTNRNPRPLDPDYIYGLFVRCFISRSTTQTASIFWIGHCFLDPGGVIEGEGAWYRQGDKVHFRPDRKSPCYAPHAPLDWLWLRNHADYPDGRLTWTLRWSDGSFRAVQFNFSAEPIHVDEVTLPIPEFKILHFKTLNPSWLLPCWSERVQWWYTWLNEETENVLAPMSLIKTLDQRESIGANNMLRLKIGEAFVARAFKSDPNVTLHSNLFPEMWLGRIAAITMWSAHKQAKTTMRAALPFFQRQEEVTQQLHVPMTNYGTKQKRNVAWLWKPLGLVCLVAAGYCAYKGYQVAKLFSSGALKQAVVRGMVKDVPVTTMASEAVKYVFNEVTSRPTMSIDGLMDLTANAGRACLKQIVEAPMTAITSLTAAVALEWEYDLRRRMFMEWGWAWKSVPPLAQNLFRSFNNSTFSSAFSEEAMKRLHPVVEWLFPLGEFAFYVRAGIPWPIRIPALVVHYICNRLPVQYAIGLHLTWNTTFHFITAAMYRQALHPYEMIHGLGFYTTENLAPLVGSVNGTTAMSLGWFGMTVTAGWAAYQCYQRSKERYIPDQSAKTFIEDYHLSDWNERKIFPDIEKKVEKITVHMSRVPNQTTSHVTKRVQICPLLKVKGELEVAGQREPPSWTFHILMFNVPMYRPSHTNANVLAMIYYRILVPAPGGPDATLAWNAMEQYIPLLFQREQFPPYEALAEPWVEQHTGPTLQKYRRALTTYTHQGDEWVKKHSRYTNIMPKCDEVLIKADDGWMQMKPRAIAVVHEAVIVRTGPIIHYAQGILKKQWGLSSEPIVFQSKRYHLYVASGWSDADLSHWAQLVLGNLDDFHILCSGDDSLVWSPVTKKFHEGDLSMCDQSQGFGAIRFARLALEALGSEPAAAQLLEKLTTNQYRYFSKPVGQMISIDRKDRPERDSGGPDTSVGNSIHTGSGLFFHHARICSFETLGMSMKESFHDDIYSVTFLKGMWYHTTQGPYWGPLPSRVVKVGKSFKNPTDLYTNRPAEEAGFQFLRDLAAGYATYLQVPVLRRFCSQFAGTIERDVLHREWISVESADTTKPMLTDEVWVQMWNRYGLGPEDFSEMEDMIPDTPYFYLSHPGFLTLALRDYS